MKPPSNLVPFRFRGETHCCNEGQSNLDVNYWPCPALRQGLLEAVLTCGPKGFVSSQFEETMGGPPEIER